MTNIAWKDQEKWEELTKGMGIPLKTEYGCSIESYMRWFLKNGGIVNSNHPNYQDARSFANKCLRTGGWDTSDNDRYYK